MERIALAAIRFRWPIVLLWAGVIAGGLLGASRLGALQSNVFTVPGSDSDEVRVVLQEHFGDRPDGLFTVVFRLDRGDSISQAPRLQHALEAAAATVPTAVPIPLRRMLTVSARPRSCGSTVAA